MPGDDGGGPGAPRVPRTRGAVGSGGAPPKGGSQATQSGAGQTRGWERRLLSSPSPSAGQAGGSRGRPLSSPKPAPCFYQEKLSPANRSADHLGTRPTAASAFGKAASAGAWREADVSNDEPRRVFKGRLAHKGRMARAVCQRPRDADALRASKTVYGPSAREPALWL